MDTTDIIYNCAQKLDCDARRFEPMSRHTSFKIGGKADVYIRVTNLSQLIKILKECDACKEKYILLGNGSNVLVPDEGIHGTVLRLDGDFRNISLIDDTTIYCGAGAALGSLCKFAQKCGLSGLEFAWGIPGTVGGAVFMNAGAYGGEMKDVVYSVSHITKNGDIGRIDADNLEFGYRTSVYRKNGCIITGAVFKLKKDNPDEIQNRMNDYMKTVYCLDMHVYGKYSGIYMRYLKERDIVPEMLEGDEEILKYGKPDYIAFNYYRTLCASYLPADDEHPVGMRVYRGNEVDFDQYGYCRDERNTNLAASEYGAQIDPMGLRIVLNDYYSRYHLPLLITENGLGMADTLTEDGKVHDPYRIDYIREHIKACAYAIEDGVELMGYSPWSFEDLLSSHQGFRKRYGFVYINREDMDLKDLARIKKDSYYWYQNVIRTNGEELD